MSDVVGAPDEANRRKQMFGLADADRRRQKQAKALHRRKTLSSKDTSRQPATSELSENPAILRIAAGRRRQCKTDNGRLDGRNGQAA
jgi:hypothetical protein